MSSGVRVMCELDPIAYIWWNLKPGISLGRLARQSKLNSDVIATKEHRLEEVEKRFCTRGMVSSSAHFKTSELDRPSASEYCTKCNAVGWVCKRSHHRSVLHGIRCLAQ